MKSLKLPMDFGGRLTSGMAGGVAGAAAASLVTGRNFGDTLIASLPSIIGNTVGNLAAEGITSIGRGGVRSPGSGGGQNSPGVADKAVSSGTSADVQALAHASQRQAAEGDDNMETTGLTRPAIKLPDSPHPPGNATAHYELDGTLVITAKERYVSLPE